jgi:hypothetical protein
MIIPTRGNGTKGGDFEMWFWLVPGQPAEPPVIAVPPISVTVRINEWATFMVLATGANRFQWQMNGVDLAGATSPVFTRRAGPGVSTIRVIVSNDIGFVESEAILRVENQ